MKTHGKQIVNTIQTQIEPNRDIDSATLLQASRRVDWRFLLPDPKLRAVAYFGPKQDTLIESLELFSERLDLFETPAFVNDAADQNTNLYDVVVAHAPDYKALEQAVGLLKPGGALYVEAQSPLWSGRWRRRGNSSFIFKQPRLWSAGHYMKALSAFGLGKMEAFGFWPNFEACTKIIPLDDPATPLQFYTPHQVRKAINNLLSFKFAQRVLHSQLFGYLTPYFAIVAS
jgi:hypothetical protein